MCARVYVWRACCERGRRARSGATGEKKKTLSLSLALTSRVRLARVRRLDDLPRQPLARRWWGVDRRWVWWVGRHRRRARAAVRARVEEGRPAAARLFFFAPASTVWPPAAARSRSTRVFLGRRVCPGRALACVSARSLTHLRTRLHAHPSLTMADVALNANGKRPGEESEEVSERRERGKNASGGGGSKGATTPPSLSAHREAAPRPTCPPPGRVSRFGAGWDRWLRVAGARPSPLPPPAPAAFVSCLRLRPGAPPSRRARELRRWQPRVFSFLLGGGAPYTCAPAAAGPFPHASLACAAGGNP